MCPNRRDDQAGSDGLQHATGNQGHAPKTLSTSNITTKAEEAQHTSHFLDVLEDSVGQRQDQKRFWRTPSNIYGLDGSEGQPMAIQQSLYLESKANLARAGGHDGTYDFASETDISPTRASSSIF